ncbi:MAG: hypothetical protein H6858_10240 [Rhodospirillales bacterium]|nr:hypothetical protein [Alphaproteobacteria bacterium]MCB9977965.1 hypothetical protein [Rhodospirillales bacterium]
MSEHFKRENFPTDGGKSFLADWHEAGPGQTQQGDGAGEVKKIEVTGGEDVSFEVPVEQSQMTQGVSSGTGQMGTDPWDNWYPSEEL